MSAIEQKQLTNASLCQQSMAEIIQQLASITTTNIHKYCYQLNITADIDRYLTTGEKSMRISLTAFGVTRTDAGPYGNETLSIYQHDSQLSALRKKAIMADHMLGNITPDRFSELAKESMKL